MTEDQWEPIPLPVLPAKADSFTDGSHGLQRRARSRFCPSLEESL